MIFWPTSEPGIGTTLRAAAAWHRRRRCRCLIGDRIEGVLIFNSSELGTFTPELVELLQRLAENVAFALGNFDRADEKARAEKQKDI